MNRHIIFRAWDPELKSLSKHFRLGHYLNFNDDILLPLMDTHEVMQFTGRKDKNGVKVFEGDLVKVLYENLFDTREYVGEIDYDGDQTCFIVDFPDECTSVALSAFQEIEVVGNVYQNTE